MASTVIERGLDFIKNFELKPSHVAVFVTALIVGIPLYLTLLSIVGPYFSANRDFPGPKPVSLWFGSLPTMYSKKYQIPTHCAMEWIQKYGWIVNVRGWFGSSRLLINDPVAMNYIMLTKPYDYPKDDGLQAVLHRLVGNGLLAAEGDAHRRQRRVIGPSFGQAHLRALYPSFYNTAQALREQWLETIEQAEIDKDGVFPDKEFREASYKTLKPGQVFVRVNKWLARAAVNIIGECGFGYNFNAFSKKPPRLIEIFSINPCDDMRGGISANMQILRELYVTWAARIPLLAKILPFDNKIESANIELNSEAMHILHEKRRMLETNKKEAAKEKDLMSLMLRANLGMGKSKLTDKELEGQMSTFIIAGSETTATALQWTLWRLSLMPHYQDKLREEIWACREKNRDAGRDEDFTVEDIEELPFLDAITREVLRVDPPVTQIGRIAKVNDQIPLLDPIKGKSGKMHKTLPVRKGTELFFSILAYNTDERVWGEDAKEFRPERWLDDAEGKSPVTKNNSTVGVYSSMLTFWSGPRACIGYKFALMEYKTFLSVLIDQFKFELRDPDMKLTRMVRMVQQPFIKGEEFNGPGMPLRISVARTD